MITWRHGDVRWPLWADLRWVHVTLPSQDCLPWHTMPLPVKPERCSTDESLSQQYPGGWERTAMPVPNHSNAITNREKTGAAVTINTILPGTAILIIKIGPLLEYLILIIVMPILVSHLHTDLALKVSLHTSGSWHWGRLPVMFDLCTTRRDIAASDQAKARPLWCQGRPTAAETPDSRTPH